MAETPREPDGSDREIESALPAPRVVDAIELFGGSREVVIELEGVRYRLRITRRKKLILQK